MKVNESVGPSQRKPGLLARYMKVIPCSTVNFLCRDFEVANKL